MKIVNRDGLPIELFNAVCHNWYGGANEVRDWSVTELINPIRVTLLQKRHDSEIEVEASQLLWAMLGSAMHIVLERGSEDKKKYLTESRFKTILNDKIISGGVDIFDLEENKIADYKFQTVWNYIYLDDHIENLQLQVSFYKELLERHGNKVNSAQIIYLFRDYQSYMTKNNPNYPKQSWAVVDIDFLPNPEEVMKQKITEIEKYKDVPDTELPLCTHRQRWQKYPTYVFKAGNKIVRRIELENEEAEATARQYIEEHPEYKYELVKEQPKRCPKYCNGRNFCDFYINEVLPYLDQVQE